MNNIVANRGWKVQAFHLRRPSSSYGTACDSVGVRSLPRKRPRSTTMATVSTLSSTATPTYHHVVRNRYSWVETMTMSTETKGEENVDADCAHFDPSHSSQKQQHEQQRQQQSISVREMAIYMLRPSTKLEEMVDDSRFWDNVETVLRWLIRPSTSSSNNVDSDVVMHRLQDLYSKHDEQDGLDVQSRSDKTANTRVILDDPTTRIRHAIRLLDRLADALEFTYTQNTSQNFWIPSLIGGSAILPHHPAQSMLPSDIVNDVLAAWHRSIKQEKSQSRSRSQRQIPAMVLHKVLPASTVAVKLDKYQLSALVEPNAKSYNIVLDVMLQTDGIKMADHYLKSLIKVAAATRTTTNAATTTTIPHDSYGDDISPCETTITTADSSTTSGAAIIDAISFGTVMKGWVQVGNPQKAQELLEEMTHLTAGADEQSSSSESFRYCQPTTVMYTTIINGWSQIGEAQKAEQVLYKLLEDYKNAISNENINNSNSRMAANRVKPDRILFHTVLDAWGRYQKRRNHQHHHHHHHHPKQQKQNNDKTQNDVELQNSNKTQNDVERINVVERARSLVQVMNDLANEYDSTLKSSDSHRYDSTSQDQHDRQNLIVRPNMETWSKLIGIVGESTDDGYGPGAAEQMLDELEASRAGLRDSDDGRRRRASIVLYNRILHGYAITANDIDGATDFFEEKMLYSGNVTPDITTFNTLLAGWAAQSPDVRPDAPIQAESWLKRMKEEFNIEPTARSYSSVLLCWTKAWRQYNHANQHAHDILIGMLRDLNQRLSTSHSPHDGRYSRQPVGKSHHRKPAPPAPTTTSTTTTTTSGITVCYNIVLKGWADQSIRLSQQRKHEESRFAIGQAVRLLGDLMHRHKELTSPSMSHGQSMLSHDFDESTTNSCLPTDVTFRTVLNGIAGSSAQNKYSRVMSIVTMMKDRGFPLTAQDKKVVKRLKKSHDNTTTQTL